MNLPPKSVLMGHVSMLVFSLLVSVSFVLGAMIANLIDPNVVTFSRFLIALVTVGALVIFRGAVSLLKLLSFWKSAVLGILISVYFITMFEGLKTSSSTSMAVVFTLTPLLAGFFDLTFSKRVMSKKVWITVVVAAIGALWIIFDATLENLLTFKVGHGERLFFLGCVCHALYAALIPKLNQGEPPIIQTFGTLFTGLILVGLVSYKEIITTSWFSLPFIVFLTIMYLALFATAASFFLIQYSAVRLSSIKVMAYTYAVPIWVVCMQAIFLEDYPDHVIIVGAALIATALMILLYNREG